MTSASELVEHYFRHEYGRLVALLTSRLGVRHWELVEEAVQTALARALTAWPRTGVPAEPSGWLYRTAKNLALDALRRQQVAERFEQEAFEKFDEARLPADVRTCFDTEIGDETLRLLYLCCHPAIASESRVALALKTVSGFGVHEIAGGLLTSAANIENILSRAQQRLRAMAAQHTEFNSSDSRPHTHAILPAL